ncbi:hypothetical protein WMW72_27735 [Paenibacillus filicis]|uniref:Uncharacterized protein n=1 Tax=Paenibacillus filicis TaxID=669464 RepID=A0ABU9DS58_9BACL
MKRFVQSILVGLVCCTLIWISVDPGFPYKQPEEMTEEGYRQCGSEKWNEYNRAGRKCLIKAYRNKEKAEFTSFKQAIEIESVPTTLRTNGSTEVLLILDRRMDGMSIKEEQRIFTYSCTNMNTVTRLSVRPILKHFFTLQNCTGENEPQPVDLNGGI